MGLGGELETHRKKSGAMRASMEPYKAWIRTCAPS